MSNSIASYVLASNITQCTTILTILYKKERHQDTFDKTD